jgi:hypothetical protein
MKKFVLIFFVLAIFASISVNAQSGAANKAWAPFLKKFSSAVRTKNRAAILSMALPRSSFEPTAGGDYAEDMVGYITLSDLRSGFKPWNGGKITRKGCLWFKFIDSRWYWAGTPCD